jgi:cold-inducible RNA-binding protein
MKNIFVGNLDFGTTEESIRALFEQYGTVDRVSLVRDRDTGQSRGFAFVEMADAAEGERAINALNGTTLGSRAINVNEARPRAERSGGGGGGGFRRNSGGGGGGYSGRRREPRW